MTEISASLVKELRERTGAGMMECKRSLQETSGDLDAAAKLLRERGINVAAQRAGRGTSEGVILERITGDRGTMVAVGCETEPVAKNEEFRAFAEKALEAVDRDGATAVEELEDERLELVARIRETIVVRAAERWDAHEGELIGGYVHPPARKIGVLVRARGDNPEAVRQVAMHVASAAPRWVRREDVPEEHVQAERDVFAKLPDVASKPEDVRAKIVEGMLGKRFFAASPGGVLLEQPWIFEPGKTVAEALRESGTDVVEFVRYALSE
jgi:elongation factor Ts